MWQLIENGQLVPLALVNAKWEIESQLRGHDTTHRGNEFPFCEDYGCGSIVAIQEALEEPEIKRWD